LPTTVRFSDELQTHSRSGLLWTTFKRIPPLRGDQTTDFTHGFSGRGKTFGGSFRRAGLTVNLRAEGEPGRLRGIVEQALADLAEDSQFQMLEAAAFRPGQPVPTARVTVL